MTMIHKMNGYMNEWANIKLNRKVELQCMYVGIQLQRKKQEKK